MNPTGRCRSCEAPIVWAVTAAGRAMPLDPDPTPDGNVVSDGRDEQGRVQVIVFAKPADVPADRPLRYASHFVSCPDADQHRRKR